MHKKKQKIMCQLERLVMCHTYLLVYHLTYKFILTASYFLLYFKPDSNKYRV